MTLHYKVLTKLMSYNSLFNFYSAEEAELKLIHLYNDALEIKKQEKNFNNGKPIRAAVVIL